MRKMSQRTEAVIRLDALAHNIRQVRKLIRPDCRLMAVLKGDAYGHGITGIYDTLEQNGVDCYAVAVWEEGIQLRQLGCQKPILILGDTCDACMENVVQYGLSQTVFSLEQARRLNEIAEKMGKSQPVHIKLDTGMSRLGFKIDKSSIEVICKIAKMPHLFIEGVFTHFSKADEIDGVSVSAQFEKYNTMIQWLVEAGIKVPLRHISNSPAIILHPETNLDAVRAGDILFALCPVDEQIWNAQGFKQVLHWYTQVAMVKQVPAGTEVGYGGTFVTNHPTTTIATIPVGFADGYSRRLSNIGYVKIRQKIAPIIGRVCMDQFMVDVSGIDDVSRGDTVTLLDDELSILKMADLIGANVDEIVCGIGKRVPRVYESVEEI